MLKDVTKAVKGNKTLMIVLGIVITLIVLAVLWKIYQGAKKGTEAAGNAGGRLIVQQQTGITPARQLVCEDVAQQAHMAIHGDGGWFKIPGLSDRSDEDEEAFITQLNRLQTANEAAYSSVHYKTFWGSRNLLTDANKYLNASERAQIKLEILKNLA